jgi:sugar-phosphatase
MPEPLVLTARAVLFDMDGTLVDSTAVVERTWTAFAEEHGLDVEAILATVHGVRAEDTIRRHGPAGIDVEATVERLIGVELESIDGILALPGAAAFVASLPPQSIALVTSAPLALASVRLEVAGVPAPRLVVTAADVEHGKPHPDGYLLAARTLGAAPEDTIVFEDAEAGIAAGLAAGMRTVVVGSYAGAITEGLPRITDYTAVTAVVSALTGTGDDGLPLIEITL